MTSLYSKSNENAYIWCVGFSSTEFVGLTWRRVMAWRSLVRVVTIDFACEINASVEVMSSHILPLQEASISSRYSLLIACSFGSPAFNWKQNLDRRGSILFFKKMFYISFELLVWLLLRPCLLVEATPQSWYRSIYSSLLTTCAYYLIMSITVSPE